MNCISLLSDFGLRDGTIASTKAILIQHARPGTPIIDLTHSTIPFNLPQAAYIFQSNYLSFPNDTCHLLLLNVFYSKTPKLLLARHNNHYILTPNNDLLQLAFRDAEFPVWLCYEMKPEDNFKNWLLQCGKVIERLQKGQQPDEHFERFELEKYGDYLENNLIDNALHCHVLHIDRYENVVLDLTQKELEEKANGRSFYLLLKGNSRIKTVSKRYTDVAKGEALCRFNHSGYLEICINGGSAASLFGLSMNNKLGFKLEIIKIIFE